MEIDEGDVRQGLRDQFLSFSRSRCRADYRRS